MLQVVESLRSQNEFRLRRLLCLEFPGYSWKWLKLCDMSVLLFWNDTKSCYTEERYPYRAAPNLLNWTLEMQEAKRSWIFNRKKEWTVYRVDCELKCPSHLSNFNIHWLTKSPFLTSFEQVKGHLLQSHYRLHTHLYSVQSEKHTVCIGVHLHLFIDIFLTRHS